MKNLSQINENNDIITKEYLEEEGNASTAIKLKYKEIPSGSDLNNYVEYGGYIVSTINVAQTILNTPFKRGFSLHVVPSGAISNYSTATQILIGFITTEETSPKIFIRNYYTASDVKWSDWKQIAYQENLTSALTGYLPLSGGTLDGQLILNKGLFLIGDQNSLKPIRRYVENAVASYTGAIFTHYKTVDDLNNNYPNFAFGNQFSPDGTANYIYLNLLPNPETSKTNYYQRTLGLSIDANGVYWKGKILATKDDLVVMTGSTTSVAGKSGLVPAPAAGSATRYLRSDGTWQVPPNTTYTLSSFGITATAAELNKLDGATVTVSEINYLDGVKSNIQDQIDNKVIALTQSQYNALKTKAADTLYCIYEE